MPIKIQRLKILNQKNKKAEFTVVFSEGKKEATLIKLVAVSGSKGIFVKPYGKSIKTDQVKDGKPVWKEIPYYYFNKPLKDEIEKLVIPEIAKVDK